MTAAAPSSHLAYRGDIDGLRALAVIPVVLFHAGMRGFRGGFVGVDIFFVISGFLITGILLRDAQMGRLSIAEFYRRRILRIFPALVATALFASVGAVIWLLPGEWERFARSLIATALFGSNISFYLATDYFNLGALSEPLLHTWSLAVEEQWYLAWPLVIGLLARRRRGLILGVVGAITALSFAYAIWLLPRDPSATFYLLPTRAWELGIGAWLAVSRQGPAPRWLAELMSVAALAMIGIAVKFYTETTPFPGLTAALPCLGAALLIHAGRSRPWVSRLLAGAPFRQVGLISYSLYLWHWPIIVFAQGGLFIGHDIIAKIGLILTILLVSVASWWWIERPFRLASRDWSTPRVLWGGAAAMLALIALALALPVIANSLSRYDAKDRQLAGYLFYKGDEAYRAGHCFKVGWNSAYRPAQCLATSGKPAIAFVGDSHAAHLWPGLSRYADRYDLVQATAIGCVARIPQHMKPGSCEAVVGGLLTGWLRDHRPAALVIASRWRLGVLDGVERTLRDPLVRRSHPLLVGPIPQYETELPRLILAARRRDDPDLPRRMLLDEMFAVDGQMRAIAARTGTPYLSLIDLMCDAQRHCRTQARPDEPMQFDYGHLTAPGSAFVADAILAKLRAAYPEAMAAN
ncbi:acyltransferase family protein [Sphingobium sp.]|uniref:acyltransferase family protein n=1 Tax=Sphingobium sp. TaxID=1912891 RepID=UPI0025D157A8|nr:acyltransferase family protein [Sphingobium sp.]